MVTSSSSKNGTLRAQDEPAAVEMLHDLGCTDGLPVVVPTPERVDEMLAAAPSFGRDDLVGVVAPRMGRVSVADIAANAVMAGCLPAHFPIVVAAVRAVCDPAFALGVVQGTTHNAAVLTIVNGPARLWPPALATSSGALGPGHRPNATIGRAVRLVLINAGGALPGATDMSTLGQPAKFTCCLAEAEEDSPWPPLASARGVAAGRSAVTAIAVEGPSQIMFVPIGDSAAADARRIIELVARTVAVPGALASMGYAGSAAVALCPLHAQVLADASVDRGAFCSAVFEHATHRAGEIRRLHGFIRGEREPFADDDAVPVLASPEHLIAVVAGGAGTYSAVFCGLAAGVGDAVTTIVGSPTDPSDRNARSASA
jgi:hypothetical protein